MAEITVNAIVLRRRDSGESDRRLTILTREQGKIDVVAKGARKAGSRLAGSSDPLAVAQLGLATGKKNTFITQTQPLASFRGLRTDYDKLSFALALLELYAAVVPYEQADSDVYDLLVLSLHALEAHAKPAVALVWTELQLLSYAGFLPQFDVSAVSGEPLALPRQVANSDPRSAIRNPISEEPNALDSPQQTGPPCFVSPTAGGYVTGAESLALNDRFRVRAEALLGLARMSELSEPPPNLKFADECLIALFPFWRHVAEAQLPANESIINELRLKVLSGG